MSADVLLDRDQVRSILSLYHLDALEDFGGLPAGAVHRGYWVVVGGKKYLLRIAERKRIDDMIFEKEVLLHLERARLAVPRLVKNVARGTFTPWSRGRYVSLFEYMPGRPLGVFEVRPRHARSVGALMARMHRALETFQQYRANVFALPSLDSKLQRLERALQKKRLAQRFIPDVAMLRDELEYQKTRSVAGLPSGTVHGGLLVENAKFLDNRLVGALDFDMAATERWTWDLAVAMTDWCWEPSATQAGGPAGRFDPARVRTLLKGYVRSRRFSPSELRAVEGDLRLACARFAIARLVDFELARRSRSRTGFKDYRHYTARLRSLAGRQSEELVRAVLQ